MRPPTRRWHANHMRPTLPCTMMCAPEEDDITFADRHLQAVLSAASLSSGGNVDRVMLPPAIITFLPAVTLFAGVVLAGDAAAQLDCVCWPAVDASCAADPMKGVGAGLIGAGAAYASEAWRTSGRLPDETTLYDTDPCLAHAVLVGTWPLALFANIMAEDATVGERAVDAVLENESPLPGALLHLAGTTAACAWAHGVLQQSLDLGLTNLAISNAMRYMPTDTEGVWWWPLIAAGTALAPITATFLTAVITAAADTTVWRALQPSAAAVGQARIEAVRVARERAPTLFRLDGRARPLLRASAFDAAAERWEKRTRERDARFAVASAARSLAAATAYAASGHSQLAPLLCGVLGGSSTVRAVLSGKE